MRFDNVELATRPEITVQYNDLASRPCTVSVCEWANGEGWDIVVRDHQGAERTIPLADDDLRAVNAAVTMLGLRPEEEGDGQS